MSAKSYFFFVLRPIRTEFLTTITARAFVIQIIINSFFCYLKFGIFIFFIKLNISTLLLSSNMLHIKI